MDRTPLNSKNLVSVGYDPDTWTLEVEFTHLGEVYQYANVPPEVYDSLIKSPSPGTYFARYIKLSYPYSRVS